MKEVLLSEEAKYLKLFNRMLTENKLFIELQMKSWPQRRQSREEVYKLSFKENLIKRLVKYTLSKKIWSNSNKKFFVLGLRYKEILTSLPKAETLLIASSFREVLFSIFRGYNWIYLGQANDLLLKSFFETDTNQLFSLFKKVILLLNKSNRKKFILSTCDTKALPTLFRWASKLNKEINHTVCLQHGVFFKENIYYEGNLSDFNLLFSSSQVNFAKKIFDKPDNLIELGPPWNIPVVEDRSSCEVILVSGGGWGQENELHLKTLDILIDVSRLLDKLKIDYSFRPHPDDILKGENKNFRRINSQPAEQILSGNPKIFIGFVSTLLLDAYCCGHTIIQINHEMQKDKLILESDFVILEKELNLIPQIIEDNIILKRRNRDLNSNTLDLRLRDAFNHIEKKLLENNIERKKNDLRGN